MSSNAEKIDINRPGAFAIAVAARQRHREIPSQNRASEDLTNERTFLEIGRGFTAGALILRTFRQRFERCASS